MATDWDKELAKIDKQLASISDEELARAGTAPPVPAGKGKAPAASARAASTPAAVPRTGRMHTFWLLARVAIAVAAAGFVLFWPYPKRCGMQLGGYLAATGLVSVAGVWASVWSWRHRSALGHLLGLAAASCGLVLAALEVLPKVGYAIPTADHPASWTCGVQPTTTAPQPAPAPQQTTPAPQPTQPTQPTTTQTPPQTTPQPTPQTTPPTAEAPPKKP